MIFLLYYIILSYRLSNIIGYTIIAFDSIILMILFGAQAPINMTSLGRRSPEPGDSLEAEGHAVKLVGRVFLQCGPPQLCLLVCKPQ